MSALISLKNLPLSTLIDMNKDQHHYHMPDLSTQYYHNLKSLYWRGLSSISTNHHQYY